MDPSEHSVQDFSNLVDKLGNMARKLGLYLHGAAIIPPPHESEAPVVLQVSFSVGDKADFPDEEHDDELKKQFEDILRGSDAAAHEQRLEAMRKDMESGDFFKGFET